MQKQIVAQIQHQQKLADMPKEQRLAHQAYEWTSQSPEAGSDETPTGYANAVGDYPKYRKYNEAIIFKRRRKKGKKMYKICETMYRIYSN